MSLAAQQHIHYLVSRASFERGERQLIDQSTCSMLSAALSAFLARGDIQRWNAMKITAVSSSEQAQGVLMSIIAAATQ